MKFSVTSHFTVNKPHTLTDHMDKWYEDNVQCDCDGCIITVVCLVPFLTTSKTVSSVSQVSHAHIRVDSCSSSLSSFRPRWLTQSMDRDCIFHKCIGNGLGTGAVGTGTGGWGQFLWGRGWVYWDEILKTVGMGWGRGE